MCTGKTVVVTGANSGIGKVTVLELYKLGAKVIMACRDLNKAQQTVDDIQDNVKNSKGELVIQHLDLASLKSVRQCAENILQSEKDVNILINNAGVMMCPKSQTEDGFETHFGVNHLGHFLFTCLLLPKIIQSAPSRIINVSSRAHTSGRINFDDLNSQNGYSPLKAYAQSKLANLLFSMELAEKLKGKSVNVYSLHPGMVKTELGRNLDTTYFRGARLLARTLFYFFLKTPEQGAQTTLYCALDEKLAEETGYYYSDCKRSRASNDAMNTEYSKRLWDESVKMVGIENYDPFASK